jgi:hypothetical protein
MNTTIRVLATVATITLGCTIEAELPREVDADDPFRDGGCGALREPGIGTQKCTYSTRTTSSAQYDTWRSSGACKEEDFDHLYCTYEAVKNYEGGRWCYWTASAEITGCAAPLDEKYPSCNDAPELPGVINQKDGYFAFDKKIEATLDLPEGNKLCDPKKDQADLDSYCRSNVPAQTHKELLALCTGAKPETKELKVDCCVKSGKPCVIVDEDTGEETTFDCIDTDALATTSGDEAGSDDDVWPPDLGSADAQPVPIPD